MLVLAITAQAAQAGWISEISFQSRQVSDVTLGSGTMPGYVEVSAVPTGRAVDLVVLDATSTGTKFGKVLQVVTLPATTWSTRLWAFGSWPADVFPGTSSPAGGPILTVAAVNTFLGGFSASTKINLVLYDRATTLPTGAFIKNESARLASTGAVVLDVITWGTTAKAFGSESVQNFAGATTVTRPNATESTPGDVLLKGTPSLQGYLTDYSPAYQLNPGRTNTVWTQPNPEPATGALIMIGAAAILGKRWRAQPWKSSNVNV